VVFTNLTGILQDSSTIDEFPLNVEQRTT